LISFVAVSTSVGFLPGSAFLTSVFMYFSNMV
jgi:hypothetical protein